ncbi:RecB family nuclease, putative, TM0106 family [Nakamurella panacisegetis]|uniref:RecB family nuclease, putative, TM0106 family n=1 Tax=Nakamurella panacisegetis TaxID=1090615 RepID=A0A1H0KAE6_9ACTN|nr:TM0106 family RecB-like putative nuclease [Nakamurella panacisegetis]SDO52925.1 RecB family nuclease, putative, TM0106 family [Nakamurella panacisegetis]
MTLAGSSATGPADLRPGPPATPSTSVRLGPAAAGRCRRRVHLDADPDAPRAERSAVDDGLKLRLTDGANHRSAVLSRFAAQFVVDGQPAPWDPAGAERPLVVFEPSLRSSTRFGTPDLLLWAGDGYQPLIIRSHRTCDPGAGALTSPIHRPLEPAVDPTRKARAHAADALALAHHYRLLVDLGLASATARGAVVGSGGPGAGDAGVLLWHQLDLPGGSVLADYDRRFADRLAVAGAAAAGRPALALASRIGECRRCSWWPVCSADLLAARDISLVAAGGDVDVLHQAGVRTVDDLARLDPAIAAGLPLTGAAPGTARVRARAWLAGLPLVRKVREVSVRRADLELDVDMESFLEDGAYLWGTYLTGPGVETLGLEPGYRGFVSWNPLPDRDEGRAFAEFWSYLTRLRSLAAANGLTFAAYCYSRSAEERWLRSTPIRYPDVPGMPRVAEISAFCASDQWIDIYQEIRDQFIVPGSMKLKALAPLAGFHWRDPEPGGENSMAWYREAVGTRSVPSDGPVDPVDRAMATRILQYNEDDVLATLALRRWMTDRSTDVPTAAELDADE